METKAVTEDTISTGCACWAYLAVFIYDYQPLFNVEAGP